MIPSTSVLPEEGKKAAGVGSDHRRIVSVVFEVSLGS